MHLRHRCVRWAGELGSSKWTRQAGVDVRCRQAGRYADRRAGGQGNEVQSRWQRPAHRFHRSRPLKETVGSTKVHFSSQMALQRGRAGWALNSQCEQLPRGGAGWALNSQCEQLPCGGAGWALNSQCEQLPRGVAPAGPARQTPRGPTHWRPEERPSWFLLARPPACGAAGPVTPRTCLSHRLQSSPAQSLTRFAA